MPTEFKSFYKTVEGNEGNKCHYPTRLDTYGCGCFHNCAYCLSGDTPILLYDGTQIPLKDVQIGQEIYGYEKNRLTKSIVTNKWKTDRPAYRIELANGRELICSGDHRWLSNRGWKHTHDFTADDAILGADDEYRLNKIESLNKNITMYDISTTTENFIANGCVSHNCYSKSLLGFRGMWHPDDPSVADIDKIRKQIDDIPKDTIVRLGGMTDCFQKCEEQYNVTYETIKCLQEHNLGYLIVTKSDLVASERYTSLMDTKLAHIQISVTSTDDDYSKTIENAPVPSERIKAIETLQDKGYDVTMRLSPYMPDSGHMDMNIINDVRVDKVLVEFLRINTFIKKAFPKYRTYAYVEDGHGYKQLPLEEKVNMLGLLNRRFQISVCEDTDYGYAYFRSHFNANPDDCCNLRR